MLSHLGGYLGALEAFLEPWGSFGVSRGPLGALLGYLGALLGLFGGSWRPLGAPLRYLWGPLGAFLGSSWGYLGALCGLSWSSLTGFENDINGQTTTCFKAFSGTLGVLAGCSLQGSS